MANNILADFDFDETVEKKVFNFAPLYSGGALQIDGYDRDVYVDIDSLKYDPCPKALFNHRMDECVGYLENIEIKVDNGRKAIYCDAVVGGCQLAKKIIQAQDKLAPWIPSIGAYRINDKDIVAIDDASKVVINGAKGNPAPAYIVYNATLCEGSFVTIGGDPGAKVIASIKVNGDNAMPSFEEWLAEQNIDISALTDEEKNAKQNEYESACAEIEQSDEAVAEQLVAEVVEEVIASEDVPAEEKEAIVEEITQEIVDELTAEEIIDQVDDLEAKCKEKLTARLTANLGESRRIEAIKALDINASIKAKAIESGWGVSRTQAYAKAAINKGNKMNNLNNVSAGVKGSEINKNKMLAVALAHTMGMREDRLQAAFKTDERTVDAAISKYGRNLGFRRLLQEMGAVGAYASASDVMASLKDAKAAYSTSNAFSVIKDVANAWLEGDKTGSEPAYAKFCKNVTVTDFATNSALVPELKGTLGEVPPAGQIPYASINVRELKANAINRAMTFKIDYESIVSDQVGYVAEILNQAQRRVAESEDHAVAELFWRVIDGDVNWVNNAGSTVAMVASGTNYFTGSGSALNEDGVTQALTAMSGFGSVSGAPANIDDCIIVCGTGQFAAARKLYASETVAATDTRGVGNPYYHMFEPCRFGWIDSANARVKKDNGSTDSIFKTYGGSFWALVRKPEIRPLIYTLTVAGFESPLVEQNDYDLNTWGIQYRVLKPFGVCAGFGDAIVANQGA